MIRNVRFREVCHTSMNPHSKLKGEFFELVFDPEAQRFMSTV